jgi:cytochrome c oxidase subunit IV
MSVHVTPVRTYIAVFCALLVLTGLTVWVAFFNLGAFNNVAALGIAVVKASLVVLFFMHVRTSTRLTKLVVVGGVFWLLLLFAFTLGDYLTRNTFLGVPGK